MILNVIHKKSRTDRREHLLSEIRRQGIAETVWHDAVTDCKTKHQSIGESHKNVVRFAKEKGFESIIIAEDDLYFPAEDGWDYFLKKIPQSYGLFLGGAYSYRITYDTFEFNGVVLHKWSGMHLYAVHKSFYDTFLRSDTVTHNIERAVALQAATEAKAMSICWPFAAVQAETPSDNVQGKIYKITEYFNKQNTYGL